MTNFAARFIVAVLSVPLIWCGPALAQYDTGTTPVTQKGALAVSHPAGSSVGGLIALPVVRFNGGSGEIENLVWISVGGSTAPLTIRIWDKQPGSSTVCTDGSGFVSATGGADDSHLLVAPFIVTPVGAIPTAGDNKTYASYQFLPPLSYKNQDANATQFVYLCAVTNTVDTLDNNGTIFVDATGPQN